MWVGVLNPKKWDREKIPAKERDRRKHPPIHPGWQAMNFGDPSNLTEERQRGRGHKNEIKPRKTVCKGTDARCPTHVFVFRVPAKWL